jgi:hypothetical protein
MSWGTKTTTTTTITETVYTPSLSSSHLPFFYPSYVVPVVTRISRPTRIVYSPNNNIYWPIHSYPIRQEYFDDDSCVKIVKYKVPRQAQRSRSNVVETNEYSFTKTTK